MIRDIISDQYTHPASRAVRKIVRFTSTFRKLPDGDVVLCPTYWWAGFPNFGDALTAEILPHYGVVPVAVGPEKAEFLGVGSIIQFLPPESAAVVWGSGIIHPADKEYPNLEILALRGHLTREQLGRPEGIPLGDPGILASKLFMPAQKVAGRVAVIPHYSMRTHSWVKRLTSTLDKNALVIDVRASVNKVLQQISSAELVVTTSLHGLIIADSYGVPAVWGAETSGLHAGSFKFRDYESVLDLSSDRSLPLAEVDDRGDLERVASTVDPERLEALQNGLEECIQTYIAQAPNKMSKKQLAREYWRL